MKLTLEELQDIESEMLCAVSRICEQNNLRWFMAYGSALGAIRHQGPIPWDGDIDIYVPESDLNRFLNVMKNQLPSKYWVDYRDSGSKPRAFPRIGLSGYETEVLHIDVFRLGGLPQEIKKLRRFTTYSRVLFVTWKSKTIDIDYYYPDIKRRTVAKIVKLLTWFIPLRIVLKLIDKQANRIPFDEAKIVASPLTTRNPRRMLRKELFDESILVNYAGFKVRVPKDYEEYLDKNFLGNWRDFPPKEEREKEITKTFIIRPLVKP